MPRDNFNLIDLIEKLGRKSANNQGISYQEYLRQNGEKTARSYANEMDMNFKDYLELVELNSGKLVEPFTSSPEENLPFCKDNHPNYFNPEIERGMHLVASGKGLIYQIKKVKEDYKG